VARFVADSRGLSGRMDSRVRGNDARPCLSHSAIGDGVPPARKCSPERQGKLNAPTRHSRFRGNDARPGLSHSAIGDGVPPARECSQERQGKLNTPARHSREGGNPGGAGEMDSRLRVNDTSHSLRCSAIGDGCPPAWECSQERQGKLNTPARHSREGGNPGGAGEMDSRVRGNDRGRRE
jgi:hypothetical protein